MPSSYSYISRSLAKAFVLGAIREEDMIAHAAGLFFRDSDTPAWLPPLARHVEAAFADSTVRPMWAEVCDEIVECEVFNEAWDKGKASLGSTRVPVAAKMVPGRGAPSRWQVPDATDLAELARVLELHLDDLGWLSSQSGMTRHYHLRWHRKKGNPNARLIEIPKPMLKDTQRIILNKILDSIPVHESACGFQKGRSIMDFAAPHTNQEMVLKMDLKDFFPSISSSRVFRLFMTAGYPESVAGKLADLCTNRIDEELTDDSNLDPSTRRILQQKHLPQGAPTSPALANLIAFGLDCRLAGLARSAGINYTRYADDLLFSGGNGFKRQCQRFHLKVLTIVIEEGFRMNTRKTRFMPGSQRQTAVGLVLNEKPNLRRSDFDELKAILTNCVRHGWRSQNRKNHDAFRSHLQGRVGWAHQANPEKAEKLWRLFEQINWS